MILCIGATPAAQRVMVFRSLTLDSVNRATTTLDGVAGKAINVAKVLKSLGANPVAVGFLGGDHGERIRHALRELGIEQAFVAVQPPTRQCITVIDQHNRTQTELVEESHPVPIEHYETLLGIIRQQLPKCRASIISGTLTPGGPNNFYLRCVHLANETSALSILDAKGEAFKLALPAKPGLVKPNRTELSATTGRTFQDESSLASAMRTLWESGAQRVVITAGKESTLAFDGQSFWRITTIRIDAVNPIGSGDSFTAALTVRLLAGDDLGEACRWGSAAGTANALTLMAGEVDLKEVERLAKRVTVEKTRFSPE